MKRRIPIFSIFSTLALLLMVGTLVGQDVISGFENYINSNSSYLSALSEYFTARYNYENAFNKSPTINLNPEITISTAQNSNSNVFSRVNIPLVINFANVDGFNLNAEIGFSYDYSPNSNSFSVEPFAISLVNNNLFQEDTSSLTYEMQYLSSLWNLVSLRNELLINYIQDTFNSYYLNNKLEILKAKYDIKAVEFRQSLEKNEKGLLSDDELYGEQIELYNLKNQILEVSNGILDVKKVGKVSKDTIEELFAILSGFNKNNLPSREEIEKAIEKRLDIEAQRIAITVAEKNLNNYFIKKYDPAISVTLSHSNPTNNEFSIENFKLSSTLSFNIPILDKGELQNTKRELEQKLKIERVKLSEKLDDLKTSLQKTYTNIEKATNNLEISKIELKMKQKNYEEISKNSQYYAPSKLKLSELDYKLSTLELENAKLSLIISALQIYNLMGMDIYALLGGEPIR